MEIRRNVVTKRYVVVVALKPHLGEHRYVRKTMTVVESESEKAARLKIRKDFPASEWEITSITEQKQEDEHERS